jgi:hypothetical protein
MKSASVLITLGAYSIRMGVFVRWCINMIGPSHFLVAPIGGQFLGLSRPQRRTVGDPQVLIAEPSMFRLRSMIGLFAH